MSQKVRCQSCGMPIADDSAIEFCQFCFKDDTFTNPSQTLEQMIESSIKQMTEEFAMPLEQASELANSFIPTLKRWL